MKLTKRGRIVTALGLALLFAGAIWLANNIHWKDTGYCWGSFNHCYPSEFKQVRVQYETL